MTDKQLYRLCKKYGRRALEARRRFAGLLPEVLKRRLYEKKGFTSIYEFAARLAGLTRENVDMVLRLERRFEGLPELHHALTEGKISASQLVRVASVATTSNQEQMFEAARNLSRRALDVFVKDYKMSRGPGNEELNGLFEPQNDVNSLAGQTFEGASGPTAQISANHDFEILAKLSPEVKNKLKEMMDKGLDINKELMQFFEAREQGIAEEKERATSTKQPNRPAKKSPTRHIPAKVKKILKKEYGFKCAKAGCGRVAAHIHHIRRFALTKDNSPQNLEPLCAGHHEIEHGNDPAYQRFRGG